MDIKTFIDGTNAAIALPLYIQIALGSGYIGYLIARSGLSYNDKPINVIFMSLAFSLASILLQYIIYVLFGLSVTWCLLLIAIFPILLGAVWRKWLHHWIMKLLWRLRICNTTEHPDLWSSIFENTKVGCRQITVYLKNGIALSCQNTYDFIEAPIREFGTDNLGNVALYVTDEKLVGENEFKPVADDVVVNDDKSNPYLYRLTYIPKDEISRIEVLLNHPH